MPDSTRRRDQGRRFDRNHAWFSVRRRARVVASLWEVDDRATAELMKRFYEGMFVRHETAAAALRAAQLEVWKIRGWDAPYYWAAFLLQGEWR